MQRKAVKLICIPQKVLDDDLTDEESNSNLSVNLYNIRLWM
jgi:hypothetical protein